MSSPKPFMTTSQYKQRIIELELRIVKLEEDAKTKIKQRQCLITICFGDDDDVRTFMTKNVPLFNTMTPEKQKTLIEECMSYIQDNIYDESADDERLQYTMEQWVGYEYSPDEE